MISSRRRGQAALEYLITYGWGLIILLVIVGAMAYMGFLNPTRYIPARCEFGSQLQCIDYKLTAIEGSNGQVELRFRNNFGDNINITRIETVNGNGVAVSPALRIAEGNSSDVLLFNIDETDTLYLSKGDRASVQLIITFQRDLAGSPLHNVTGEIFATVQ